MKDKDDMKKLRDLSRYVIQKIIKSSPRYVYISTILVQERF